MFAVYGILIYIFSIFFLPIMAVKLLLRGKTRAGVRQRFGFFKAGFFGPDAGKRVWIHAVSVGEALAAAPLVKALKARHPDLHICFSTVTETGNGVAMDSIGADARIFYFPFDFGFVVRRVVGLVRPDAFVVVETEIWPNLIKAMYDKRIPSVLVNGRISARSFRGYSRARFFFKRVLTMLSGFSMQTQADAERIKALGAPPERVRVLGNVKFDQACVSLKEGAFTTKAKLGIPESATVFIAGSTHEGEEVAVLKAYRRVLENLPETALVLAPRHPERLSSVASMIEREGFKYRLRSVGARRGSVPGTAGRYNGRTCRHAGQAIKLSAEAFVPVGGHNILEPAAFGSWFLGPHMLTSRDQRDTQGLRGWHRDKRRGPACQRGYKAYPGTREGGKAWENSKRRTVKEQGRLGEKRRTY
jgi:3-deoxy-D-manno-octulosonic-acid transferase